MWNRRFVNIWFYWSGRDLSAGCVEGDLNAPEAHMPPWRVALSAWRTPTLIPMCQATYVLDRTSEIFFLSWPLFVFFKRFSLRRLKRSLVMPTYRLPVLLFRAYTVTKSRPMWNGRGERIWTSDFLLPKQAESGSKLTITYQKYNTFEIHLFSIFSDHTVHGVHDIN